MEMNQENFPKNAMFGHCYVMNQMYNRIYPIDEGFNNGTIFPELYSPYSAGDSFREMQYLKNYSNNGGR